MGSFLRDHDILKINMVNFDENGIRGLRESVNENWSSHMRNILYLLPMQSNDTKKVVFKYLAIFDADLRYANCSVIFYQTEASIWIRNTGKNIIAVFVLNYKSDSNYLGVSPDDVENSFYDFNNNNNPLNDNLHVAIFGAISKKPSVLIQTLSTLRKSAIKTPFHSGSGKALLNFGNADIYLSNFIARNTHVKDLLIEHIVQPVDGRNMNKTPICTVNGITFTELYNVKCEKAQLNARWLDLDIPIQNRYLSH